MEFKSEGRQKKNGYGKDTKVKKVGGFFGRLNHTLSMLRPWRGNQ